MEEFFSETPEVQVVFKKEDYFQKYDHLLKSEITWVVPDAQKNKMEPILSTIKPGGSTNPDNPHEGEEFGYVLKGSIQIHIGNKIHKAKKGESFYFIPHKIHYISSPGKSGATILWVSSPPSF